MLRFETRPDLIQIEDLTIGHCVGLVLVVDVTVVGYPCITNITISPSWTTLAHPLVVVAPALANTVPALVAAALVAAPLAAANT